MPTDRPGTSAQLGRLSCVSSLPCCSAVTFLLTCRFDPLGICPKNEEEFRVMRTKEINNGRLAMIAVAGFVAQEFVNYKQIIPTLRAWIGK